MSAATVTQVLDCRALRATELPAAALDMFDALDAGQRVRLLCVNPPAQVLQTLHLQRGGAFEWASLREGPTMWEVEVERRAATVGSRREITDALAWDHDRLDALEESAFEAWTRGSLERARESFAEFAHGLRRHIDFEEQLLFPEFEARSMMAVDHGPTVVMRAEHQAIQALLAIMASEIDDPATAIELTRVELRQILHDHDLKEEKILYPSLDRLLDETESDRMVARVQAWARG